MDKGTGLGLSTVYGIVKQNSGFIKVYSETGQGTTFRIYLPRQETPVSKVQQKRPLGDILRGHETILLVEDEASLLKMVRQMLEKFGYRVLAASSPGEAFRIAKAHSGEINLLITDIVMPEMNGRDLAKELISLYPSLRYLLMSGYSGKVFSLQGILDENENFIQKPFSMQELGSKVRAVIETP